MGDVDGDICMYIRVSFTNIYVWGSIGFEFVRVGESGTRGEYIWL